MRSIVSARRRARLIRQLRAAHDALAAWDASLRALTSRPAAGSPHDLSELLSIVADAKAGLTRLLAQMGAETACPATGLPAVARGTKTVRSRPRELAEAPGMNVQAARACGRALGDAFREAQGAADAAAASLLYGSLRALEKQLWVLDPRQAG